MIIIVYFIPKTLQNSINISIPWKEKWAEVHERKLLQSNAEKKEKEK